MRRSRPAKAFPRRGVRRLSTASIEARRRWSLDGGSTAARRWLDGGSTVARSRRPASGSPSGRPSALRPRGAGLGELGVIPGSMGARSFIVRRRGNPESSRGGSHGAGPAMSRGEAEKRFTREDHRGMTERVECRMDAGVLDETPAAYKDIEAPMHAQADLAEVAHTLEQVVCVRRLRQRVRSGRVRGETSGDASRAGATGDGPGRPARGPHTERFRPPRVAFADRTLGCPSEPALRGGPLIARPRRGGTRCGMGSAWAVPERCLSDA